jgi:hypothetical protein
MVEALLHVVLDEEQFRALVSGAVVSTRSVTGRTVNIALSDIGWMRMSEALTDAWGARINAGYRDPTCQERRCDRCGEHYRGPAVYCSHACAVADG